MYLLDTHCWLWLKAEPARLPSPLRRRLLRSPEALVLSSVAVMEVTVKSATGRLRLDGEVSRFVAELLDDGVRPLAVTLAHALRLGSLAPLHRDPFDRLLVAQALEEGLTLVSADPQVLEYDVPVLDARK